jgi:beta-aspartyl-peptidase (threonine type)
LPIALAVHGGAWNIPDDAVQPSLQGVRAALGVGWRELEEGRSALDVVELTVRALEDDPVFDAGRGSRLNNEGTVELDASIMTGATLRAGSVAAIRDVPHPVSVARLVMERSPHVMLVGEGARKFAVSAGAETCRTLDLLVGRERQRYLRVRAGERDLVEKEFDPEGNPDATSLGTVGTVALDSAGRLAAATSTGGTQDKAAGRVGDTPIIGAGTYADDRFGAASATGWGEAILRVLLTKSAVDHLAAGLDVELAADKALSMLDRVRGKGGLILVDHQGRLALAFNTPRMARAWATETGGMRAAVEPEEPAP